MAAPSAPNVADALDNLVDQFSDPLSFFRELVQNAIDAGTGEVEIRLEYRPGANDNGVMIVHVDDFGDGMDREVIDQRLTRLFSSAKDGDLTKIGRFGIGFVSVFAIEPDAVCVDTSRAGENWRVLFESDKSFTRIARDTPVDGTKVSIYKSQTQQQFEQFRKDALRVVKYWCKHARGEVSFDGTVINEAFDVPGPCKVRHRAEGTEIVASFSPDGKPWFGFYNRGLTLLEGREGFFDNVSFKVSSRHLEHTLTRDNVIRDDAFEDIIESVRELVHGELLDRLFDMLEQNVEGGRHKPVSKFLHARVREQIQATPDLVDRFGARKLLRSIGGQPITLKTAHTAAGKDELFSAAKGSVLGRALAAAGKIVLSEHRLPDGDPPLGLRAWPAGARYCTPVLVEGQPPTGWQALRAGIEAMLEERGARTRSIVLGSLGYAGSRVGDRVAITQREVGELTLLSDADELPTSMFSRKRHLVINADHPALPDLLQIASREPELAGYLFAKLFLFGEREENLDNRLSSKAMEMRWNRSMR